MHVLTIASQKGGVGKTTLALNVALALARRGWRTLLVDTDPQGAIGLSLAQQRGSRQGLAEFISEQRSLSEVLLTTRLPELRLLPIGHVAIQDTLGFGAELANGQILSELVQQASQGHDLMIIDTPAGFGGCTMGALKVATAVLSPLQAEPLAMRSMPQLLEVMAWLKQQPHAPEFLGFVLTMVEMGSTHSVSATEELWKIMPKRLIFDTMIMRDQAFLKATAKGAPLALLSKNPPPSAAAFEQLAGELEAKLNLRVLEDEQDEPVSLFFD